MNIRFGMASGRTSRALFYWYMLKSGYDVFKYISISRLLHAAPVNMPPATSTPESDGMDLTYFLNIRRVSLNVLCKTGSIISMKLHNEAQNSIVCCAFLVLKRLNPRRNAPECDARQSGKEYTKLRN